MNRLIAKNIQAALKRKIVLLSGPRQVGKTTLARSFHANSAYYNYDLEAHRLILRHMEWKRDAPLVIFDELHKMRSWKRWLKGIYDTEGISTPILVTGSARLDLAKRVGDSLAGRYLQFHLFPLCPKEILQDSKHLSPDQVLQDLLTYSGFPEPFLNKDPVFHGQWQTTHLDIILRQDLIDTESLRDIIGIETLLELISGRIGQLVSYESLARDLERSATTVKRWIEALENLYIVFSVTPFSLKIPRTLRKARKYYLYDISRVKNGEAAKLENLLALALRKECSRLRDCLGQRASLNFLRTKEGHEVDFIVRTQQRNILIECKWSDNQFHKDFKYFARFFGTQALEAIQLVGKLTDEKQIRQGPKMVHAAKWLAELDLNC